MVRAVNSIEKKVPQLKGKTIKSATATNYESADSCRFAVVELRFTDGSSFSFTLHALPRVTAIIFKNDDDDNPKELLLVDPQ